MEPIDPIVADAKISDAPSDSGPSRALKDAVQELLKLGTLEAATRPNLYRTLLAQPQQVGAILAPLDLSLTLDEVRGIALLTVTPDYSDADQDEWNHPLVRRQRLTLEQSLLVALLRRHYVAHESESGIGAGPAQRHLDDLLPELNHFLGDKGSDAQNDKRLRQLLEQLRGHGLVSEVDNDGAFTIRPLIVHLANPENLTALLATLKEHVARQEGPRDE